jgi:predicted ATPase
MLFTLRNLGRLEEATIDLSKDLIVLTGPNNTSKTYVAHAIYGFCRESSVTYTLLNDVVLEDLSAQTPGDPDRLDVDLMKLARSHIDFMLKLRDKVAPP